MAPGTDPVPSSGESKAKMILGDRYLQFTHVGNYIGMPMEGVSLESFDNSTKELTSIWIDNMGTGMMVMKGKISDDMKTLTYNGTMVDPMSGENLAVRQISEMVNDNTIKMEMFMTSMGTEFKSMEILYTRK